jgi:hypothetical protein
VGEPRLRQQTNKPPIIRQIPMIAKTLKLRIDRRARQTSRVFWLKYRAGRFGAITVLITAAVDGCAASVATLRSESLGKPAGITAGVGCKTGDCGTACGGAAGAATTDSTGVGAGDGGNGAIVGASDFTRNDRGGGGTGSTIFRGAGGATGCGWGGGTIRVLGLCTIMG